MEQKSDRKRPENNPSQRAFDHFYFGCPKKATAETPVLSYLSTHDDVADMRELAIIFFGLGFIQGLWIDTCLMYLISLPTPV